MFLNGNPEWKAKAKAEVQSLIAKYSNSSQGSLVSQLSDLPPKAWEEEMPVMEAIIRETIRILLTGAALRRNIKEDLNIDGKVVERGAFMAYSVSSLHYDDSVYSEPFKFDPDRPVSSFLKLPTLIKRLQSSDTVQVARRTRRCTLAFLVGASVSICVRGGNTSI